MGITVADILDAISDARALAVYKTIASEKANSNLLITKMQLTRKQYYSRIPNMLKAGLVRNWQDWRWNYCRSDLSDKL